MNYLTVVGTQADLNNLVEIFKVDENLIESTEVMEDGRTVRAILTVEGDLAEISDIIQIERVHGA
jgi:hypothetical protein